MDADASIGVHRLLPLRPLFFGRPCVLLFQPREAHATVGLVGVNMHEDDVDDLLEAFDGLSDEEKEAIADVADEPLEAPAVRKERPKEETGVEAIRRTKDARRRAMQDGTIQQAPLRMVREEPEAPPVNPLDHDQLLAAAKAALMHAREESMLQGLPSTELFGFIFDLNDSLVPPSIRQAPAAQAALRNAGRQRAAIQTGIVSRSDLCSVLSWTAHKIEGTQPPILISSQYKDPAIIEKLRNYRDVEVLPVVIISMGKLSVKGLPVSALITSSAPLAAS